MTNATVEEQARRLPEQARSPHVRWDGERWTLRDGTAVEPGVVSDLQIAAALHYVYARVPSLGPAMRTVDQGEVLRAMVETAVRCEQGIPDGMRPDADPVRAEIRARARKVEERLSVLGIS